MKQKIWVYALETSLGANLLSNIASDINSFLAEWDAHGQPVSGKLDVLGDRILVISLANEQVIPSGCSKDKLDRSVRGICKNHGVSILDESNIIIKKEDNNIEILKRPEFKQRLNSGQLDHKTLLLDYSCLGAEDVKLNNIFRPIKDTWAQSLTN